MKSNKRVSTIIKSSWWFYRLEVLKRAIEGYFQRRKAEQNRQKLLYLGEYLLRDLGLNKDGQLVKNQHNQRGQNYKSQGSSFSCHT